MVTRWKSSLLCGLWCCWAGTCTSSPFCFVGRIWPPNCAHPRSVNEKADCHHVACWWGHRNQDKKGTNAHALANSHKLRLVSRKKLYQWEIPSMSHSHRINTAMHVLMQREEWGTEETCLLFIWYVDMNGMQLLLGVRQDEGLPACLPVLGLHTEQTLLFGDRAKETKYLPASWFLAAYFQVTSGFVI